MLPPGHIAAGYLTAYAVTKLAPVPLSPQEVNTLIFAGAFFGFAPDLDAFYVFFKTRSLKLGSRINHRNFWWHAPLLWLAAALAVFLAGQASFVRLLGITLWLASWSHFLFDTIEGHIRWLWPFTADRHTFRASGHERAELSLKALEGKASNPLRFYWNLVVHHYAGSVTFWFEVALLVAAAAVFLLKA